MANNNPKERVSVSTQIRTMYCENTSYMTITFYNRYLSFRLVPFVSRDQSNRNVYDDTKAITTTVDLDGAFALFNAAKNIIESKDPNLNLRIDVQCRDAVLTLERSQIQNVTQTTFSITKQATNERIPFTFKTSTMNVTENGTTRTDIVESELGGFAKILEGYLTGINADRHLNKWTDSYVESVSNQQNSQPRPPNNNRYNNRNNYRKNNNYQNYNNPQPQGQHQNMSDYQVPF